MIRFFCTILFLLITVFCLNAQQESFGIQIDAGLSTISTLETRVPQVGLPDSPNYEIANFSSSPLFALEFGVSYQYEFRNASFIQTAFLMDLFKGEKLNGVYKENSDITALNISSLNLEAYLGKKLYIKKDRNFFVAGGLILSCNYSGGYGGSADVRYYDECYYDPETDDDICEEKSYIGGGESFGVNLFGFSVGALAGYQFGNYQLGLSYRKGVNNIFKDQNFNSKLDVLKLSFIYHFYL